MDSFTNELIEKYTTYNKDHDFVVADGPQKQEVIAIIESLIGQIGNDTSNVFQIEQGALLCYPWHLLDMSPPKKDEKWTVSFRGKIDSFVLALNNRGELRGHLYSEKAEVYNTIKAFKDAQVVKETESPNLSFPVILAKR
ncbi:MAG: hypothetical protein LBU17_00980 [Treponema sp.]|jgi:hypothetical protein|nr:hypothetical protein [Treponema sp.]